MDTPETQQRLDEAREHQARTQERLTALRQAAVSGDCDFAELLRASLACSLAEAETRAAFRSWLHAPSDPDVPAAADSDTPVALPQEAAPADIVPAAPTPQLLFARWMAETGRLSEWNVSSESVQPTPRLLYTRWLVQTGQLSEWDCAAEIETERPVPVELAA